MNIQQTTIEEFLKKTASNAPTPSGGSICAVSACFATALCQMVANLTIGKEKFKKYESELVDFLGKIEQLQKDFFTLAQSDMVCLKALLKSDSEFKQNLLKKAVVPPKKVMKTSLLVLDLILNVVEKSNRAVLSDFGVAATLLIAATEGAYLNVCENLYYLKDKELAQSQKMECLEVLKKCHKSAEKVLKNVKREF